MCIDSIQRSGETLAILVGESLTEDDVQLVGESLIVKPPAANVIVDVRRMRMEEICTADALPDAAESFIHQKQARRLLTRAPCRHGAA